MKKFKFLTLTLLVLAICMTSVSATAALNPEGTYEDGIVTVTASGTAGAADATIIATRQDGELDAAPAFSEAEILASVVYLDQIPAAASMSVSFAPARVEDGDTVSVFMAGAGASGVEIANVEVEAAEEVVRTLTLNADGGSFTVTAPTEYTEAGLTLPVPAKVGYTFAGWFTTEALTGDAVTAISAEEAVVGGAKAYWAKWTANLSAFASDAGYCAEDAEAEERTGVISVTATFGNHIEGVTNAGFLVYLSTTAEEDKITISGESTSNSFYTVVYDIPVENFDTPVIFLPYVQTAEGTVFGLPQELSVEDAVDGELKYLGTIENLEAQLGA